MMVFYDLSFNNVTDLYQLNKYKIFHRNNTIYIILREQRFISETKSCKKKQTKKKRGLSRPYMS